MRGKAVIVMNIEDPGFQDFREDATCIIRPQSLIGEKYLDCRPTLPRAPGSKPPPPLKKIRSGQPGAGELLLPVENNSASVDPDLINDIHSLPYAQRFRLIFNELGATLADLLGDFSIHAPVRTTADGVWVGERLLATVGVSVRGQVSFMSLRTVSCSRPRSDVSIAV